MVDADDGTRKSREPPDAAECSPSPPSSITSEEPLQTCQENTAHDLSPPPTPRKRAPSPPKWRFVNDAKKTCGYSSLAAGCVVAGLTSDELAAKYTPPDVGSVISGIEEREVGKLGKVWHENIEDDDSDGRERISSCGKICDTLSRSVDYTANERNLNDTDIESALSCHQNDELHGHQDAAEVDREVIPSYVEEGTHRDSNPQTNAKAYAEAVCSESLICKSTEKANPLNNTNTVATSQEIKDTHRDNWINFSNIIGKRISLLLLLIAILTISIILGVVLTKNEDMTPSKEMYVSETTLWDESAIVNATTSPTLSSVSAAPSSFDYPSPTAVRSFQKYQVDSRSLATCENIKHTC